MLHSETGREQGGLHWIHGDGSQEGLSHHCSSIQRKKFGFPPVQFSINSIHNILEKICMEPSCDRGYSKVFSHVGGDRDFCNSGNFHGCLLLGIMLGLT